MPSEKSFTDACSSGLNPQFTGVFRGVAATASIPIGNGKPNVNVKRGDVVFSSFHNAQMDVRLLYFRLIHSVLTSVLQPHDFPNPNTIDPTRPVENYMLLGADGAHRCLGFDFVPNTAAGKASVISDQHLDTLLDRSPEVFVDRQKGWTSAGQVEDAGAVEEIVGRSAATDVRRGAASKAAPAPTAFAVYEAPMRMDGNLLGMMDGLEDEDEDD